MADDLTDDWWDDSKLEQDTETVEPESPSHDTEVTENSEDLNKTQDLPTLTDKPKDSKKRKNAINENSKQSEKTAKPRKRPKKKRITEIAISQRGASTGDLRLAIETFFAGKLSVVEKDAFSLSDEHFGPVNEDMSHTAPSFLKQALPKWQRISMAHSHKMAPLIIIISSNANRALDLNREAASFKGEKCRTAKLFARHIKPEAQAKFLESNVVHFAIGTPARVTTLLAQESLSLEHTRLVMLDWNWRDIKLKRMIDIVDVQNSVMNLLKDHIVPACKSHHVKIGLY